jgi:FixJ family two-component response regulator
MAEETPIVFIVDDDQGIREGVSSLLRSVGLQTEAFASPAAFLSFARPQAPSCLVLDVRLPGSSGLEFQGELAAMGSKLPIIFITGHGDVPMCVRAMKAGAIEFLIKPFRDQDLLEAVQRAVHTDRERRRAEVSLADLDERLASLTTRERQVMETLVTGQLNKQIGAALGTTESTVKAHRTQIMRKMRARSLPELVRMADKLQIGAR